MLFINCNGTIYEPMCDEVEALMMEDPNLEEFLAPEAKEEPKEEPKEDKKPAKKTKTK